MDDEVRVIAGLGNPGSEYAGTRHNLGYRLADTLAVRHGGVWKRESRFEAQCSQISIRGKSFLLVKPLTYMNRSGASLAALSRYYRWAPGAFCVAFDEINIEPGRAKLSRSGSAGGHNGVADCLARLGDGFLRLRLGVGNRPDRRIELKDWVLGFFTPAQSAAADRGVEQAADAIAVLATEGTEAATSWLRQPSNPI